MQPTQPFHRSRMMMMVIAAMMQQPGMTRALIHAQLGDYKSRGKGRGLMYVKKCCKIKGGNNAGRGIPHQNKRECERRRRQFFGNQ